MKFDNKTFQLKYEAWKNGADYWRDIRGINLGGDTRAEEPTPEEQALLDNKVDSILEAYNSYTDIPEYKGGKDDYVTEFVNRMAPLVGLQLTRYGYTDNNTFLNIMRQLAWESNYGRSRAARELHNYGGIRGNSKSYYTYKDDKDFVEKYMRMMHNRYGAALRAKTVQDYSRALKLKGYYEDTLEHYTNGLVGMRSVARASAAHRANNKNDYDYTVKLGDLVQDYDDARAASPIIINSPSTELPATIRADVPKTLVGTSQEEIKALQQLALNLQKLAMYDQLTTSALPNILNLLPLNNFGKDAYGQKFWLRRGVNLRFKGGKDKKSFNDWAQKAAKYKGILINGDPTYDYKSWYNENPNRAYALLNDDPSAHFGDKWKTPYHPTFSDESVYSNAKHPGGTWGRYDYRDAYYAPLFSYTNDNDRIAYLNMAEDNGVIPFRNNGSMYRLDGDLYGGVLPAVQVIGKRGEK